MYLKHLTIVVLEEICIHGFPRENVFEFAAQQVLRFQQRREELKPKEDRVIIKIANQELHNLVELSVSKWILTVMK